MTASTAQHSGLWTWMSRTISSWIATRHPETASARAFFISPYATGVIPFPVSSSTAKPVLRKEGSMASTFIPLIHETLRDGHAAAHAEGMARDLQTGNGLRPFVFIQIDLADDPPHRGFVKTAGDNIPPGNVLLHVKLEDAVEQIVRRQGVLIRLVRLQFGAWRFLDAGGGDDLPLPVDPGGEPVNHRLWDIAQDREPAGHVAVKRAIPHRQLALVSRRQEQASEFIGKRHERHAAQSRLHVFLRRILGQAGKSLRELFPERLERALYRNLEAADAQVFREGERVVDAPLGGILGGHGNAQDILRAERFRGDAGAHRRVDAAAEAEHHGLESAF